MHNLQIITDYSTVL